MTLREKQSMFALMTSRLLQKADSLGLAVTFGEAYRTAEQAALNAKNGRGISNSLHCKRLAIDLNLFDKNTGEFLTATEDHRELGEWWESQGGSWGGRFGDGNHYSLAHDGVR